MRRLLKWIGILFGALVLAFAGSWVMTMPDASERGTWRHEADGSLLHLTRLRATLYHQTAVGCVETTVFPAHMALVKAMEGAWIEVDGDTLDIVIDGNLAPSHFTRIDTLPPECLTPQDPTPANTFNAMWTIMDEHYPFFDLYGVDWDDRRALAPADGEAMSDTALLDRFKQALDGLDDGHIQLITPDLGYFTPSLSPAWMPDPELERNDLHNIALEEANIPLQTIDATGIRYGLSDDNIGYVQIAVMWTEPGIGQLESDLSASAFDQVAGTLAGARAIIIDVRYNPGGNDGTAMVFASFFTDTPVLALTKRTRDGTGWTDPIEATVQPAGTHHLSQPIILLTSDLTGSGAEIFTMAMRELPQVTVMGEPTGGGLSDILGTTLPNGWLFGLSHQEYLTPDGTLYEGAGLPPDIEVPIDGAALARGEDTVLRAAFEYVNALD